MPTLLPNNRSLKPNYTSGESTDSVSIWAHFAIGVALLVCTAILDVTKPFDRSWSICYVLVALYVSWCLRGGAEIVLLALVSVATFLVPAIFRPEMIWPGGGIFYRTTGTIAGLLMIALVWERRRFIDALRFANAELEKTVEIRTSELQATNESLRREIADRKKSDESLKESESRFALFMQHLPGLAWIKDTQGRYVYANGSALKVFRTSDAELYGKSDHEIFPRDTAQQFQSNDRHVLEAGQAVNVVETLEHDDGVLHHSVVSKFPMLDSNGKASHVGGLAIDITERQNAGDTIRKISAFRETIIRTAGEGICVCHAISDYPYVEFSIWNEQMIAITGYTMEEINRLGWYQSLYPDLELRGLAIERMARMREDDDLRSEEWEIVRKDGERRTVSIATSVVETDEGTPGVVALIQDITERRRAEETLHMMRISVDHAGETVFWISREGRILYVNDSGCRIHGYSREELLKMTVFDLDVEPDYQPDVWEKHIEDLKNCGSITLESKHRAKDGRVFPIEVNANYIHIGDNEFNFAFVRDITERKRTEEELRAGRQRLEELSRQLIATQEIERRHLARELHDEIGQMLTAIKMNLRRTQRIADVSFRPSLDENVAIVEQAISQVRNLALSLRPAQLDQLGLVAALHWLVKQQAGLGGFVERLDVDIGEVEIPNDLQTVCFRIAQEALTNAIRHGSPENVHTHLWTTDEQLRLSIYDDGIGFDVREAHCQSVGGNRFGLVSMQERASLVGGRALIESSPGKGTRIDCWFPLSKQKPSSEA